MPVWAVTDYTGTTYIQREILLIKISTQPPVPATTSALPPTTAMNLVGEIGKQRQEIVQLANLFQAKIIDVGFTSLILELSAKSSRLDAFVELVRPYGIIEVARSGLLCFF